MTPTMRLRITACLLVLAGCVPSAAPPPPGMRSDGEYVDRQASFALVIPSGWGEAARSSDPQERLRLRSADGRASVTVSVVRLGKSACRRTVEEWLPKAKGAAFVTTFDRSVRLGSRELPTVKGDIETLDGDSTGALSAFCAGDEAVIAAGLAGRRSSADTELANLVASFRYLEPLPPTPVPTATPAVRRAPPKPRPKPPVVRPTRRPAPEPTARSEEPAPRPTAEPTPEPAAEEPAPEDEIVPAR